MILDFFFSNAERTASRRYFISYFFNTIADMLAILIARAKEDGHIGGLVHHLLDGGLSILYYVDDTILFVEHNLAKAVSMKLILCFFLNNYLV
jgi:hypothetical protein